MSSQKGNVSRSRGQRFQNATAFKNNKYVSSVQVEKANAKVHDSVCKHCKDVLEWKVKYNKYKSLTQPRKCVKCLQKSVKDAYHIVCKPCALRLELCAKCGKKEDIVIPHHTGKDDEEEGEEGEEGGVQDTCQKRGRVRRAKAPDDDDLKVEEDFGSGSDLDSSDSDLSPRGKVQGPHA